MTTSASLTTIAKDAAGCTRCGLYKHAIQTVFGEGPLDAAIALVGEQPGDQEDKQGHPFVGPAAGSTNVRTPRRSGRAGPGWTRNWA